jgi:hypothetical protein
MLGVSFSARFIRKDRHSVSRPNSRAGYPYVDETMDWYRRRMMYPTDPMDTSMSAFYPYAAALQTPYTPVAHQAAFCESFCYSVYVIF